MALISNKTTDRKEPRIDRMLTLSAYHLTPQTYGMLMEYRPEFKTITCAAIGDGPLKGWLVAIGDHLDHEFADDLSEDMFDAVMFAKSRHCSVIHVDPTAEVIPHLKYYYETKARCEGEDT